RRLEQSKKKLFQERAKRVHPGRDEKILTAWNGLMIAAFAQAAQVLESPDYLKAAIRAANFILTRMRAADGRLLRTAGIGADAKLNGYLEDYGYMIDALVSLYEADFEPRWLVAARDLSQVMVEQFWDTQGDGFYYTGKDHERLIARGKNPHDNATPS